MQLDRFDIIALDADAQGLRNRRDREEKAAVGVGGEQEAFDAVEAATANAHALANSKKRMRPARNSVEKSLLDVFDLLIRDGQGLAGRGDKTKYAGRLEDAKAIGVRAGHADKGIARKERKIDEFAAVAPAIEAREQRKKGFDLAMLEKESDLLLVARAGQQGVPAGSARIIGERR